MDIGWVNLSFRLCWVGFDEIVLTRRLLAWLLDWCIPSITVHTMTESVHTTYTVKINLHDIKRTHITRDSVVYGYCHMRIDNQRVRVSVFLFQLGSLAGRLGWVKKNWPASHLLVRSMSSDNTRDDTRRLTTVAWRRSCRVSPHLIASESRVCAMSSTRIIRYSRYLNLSTSLN